MYSSLKKRIKKKKSKLWIILFGDLITLNINIPWFLIIFICLVPLFSYMDLVLIGNRTFWSYTGVSLLEVSILYMGYIIGRNTR